MNQAVLFERQPLNDQSTCLATTQQPPVQAHVQGRLLYWAEKPAYCKEGISCIWNGLH